MSVPPIFAVFTTVILRYVFVGFVKSGEVWFLQVQTLVILYSVHTTVTYGMYIADDARWHGMYHVPRSVPASGLLDLDITSRHMITSAHLESKPHSPPNCLPLIHASLGQDLASDFPSRVPAT